MQTGYFRRNVRTCVIMKLYIARDQSITEYRYLTDDDGIKIPGKLHVFYDTPEYKYQEGKVLDNNHTTSGYHYWTNARCMGEIPSYMYPGIGEGECVTFESIN